MVPRPSFGQEQASQASFWCWLLAAVSWPQRKNAAAMTSVELLWNPVARLWCHLHAISLRSQSANWWNGLLRSDEILKAAACACLIYHKDRADQMTWHRNSENFHGCHKGCPSDLESKVVFVYTLHIMSVLGFQKLGLCGMVFKQQFKWHGTEQCLPEQLLLQLVIIMCRHSLQAPMEGVAWASVQKSSC